MVRLNRFLICTVIMVLLISQSALAKDSSNYSDPNYRIEIILDASGSMRGRIHGIPKISIIRKALSKLSPKLVMLDVDLALRVYGHQKHHSKKYCQDTRLEIPFARPNPKKFKRTLKKIKARGQSPLAYTLSQAAQDFSFNQKGKKAIILVTDGFETCKGNPLAEAEKLAAPPLNVTLNVVGFNLKRKDAAYVKSLCAFSNGLFIKAESQYQLEKALDQIIKKILDTNLVVKGLDATGNELNIKVSVHKQGQTPLISEKTGHPVRLKLLPGIYDLLVEDICTKEQKIINRVKINNDQLTEKQVIFQRCCLAGLVKGQKGKPAKGKITIWQIINGKKQQPQSSLICKEPAYLPVVPGNYLVVLEHTATKQTKTFENVQVGPKQTVLKEANFAKARLGGMATDLKGNPIKGLITIFQKKDQSRKKIKQAYADKTPKYFELAPGVFSVSIENEKTREQVLIKNVRLKENQNLLKTVAFGSARLGICINRFKNDPFEGHIKICRINKGKTEILYSKDIHKKLNLFDVSPGEYLMELTDKTTKKKTVFKNIVLEDGQEIIKQAEM